MPIFEASQKWTFTSTGTGKFQSCGSASALTFGIITSADCTATVQIVHRMGSTSAVNGPLSTVTCSTGALNTDQFMGPLEYVAPRVTDKTANSTSVVTVYLRGV